MILKTYISLTIIAATLFPLVVAAQPQDLRGLINILLDILNALIGLIVAVAFVGFLWGVAKYILNASDPTKRAEGSKFMLYGIIGLFVMVSIWAIIGLLTGTFLGGSSGGILLPQLF